MKRPNIKTFFPEYFAPKDVARMFHENPELKQYIHALDAYIDHLEENQGWSTDMENIPKHTDLLFVVGEEVKFGQFEYYDPNKFECLSEMVTPDGEYEQYNKDEVSKWRLLPKPLKLETNFGDIDIVKDPNLGPDEVRVEKPINFQIIKDYTQEEIDSTYRKNVCPECKGKLVKNGTTNEGWTYKSKCESCHTNFLFDESDMGQTLPYLRKNPDQS